MLSPIGWIYGLVTQKKLAATKAWMSTVPVICVGNLVAGGAGKTPVALDLGRRFQSKGKSVHFLSRGYGGTEKGLLRVDPAKHDFTVVGDEPLLLAANAPTWVSKERKAGCLAAADAGADIIILDDGFQNPYIHKNFSMIVVDGSYGFGNEKMIPAGPLRESIPDGLSRAQAAVIIGEDTTGSFDIVASNGLSPLRADLVVGELPLDITGKAVIPFTGIGRPEKFFKTVSELDCSIVTTIPFADHHPYKEAELTKLKKMANNANARLLTTEKDAMRLPSSFLDDVGIISITLRWSDEAALDILLDGMIHA